MNRPHSRSRKTLAFAIGPAMVAVAVAVWLLFTHRSHDQPRGSPVERSEKPSDALAGEAARVGASGGMPPSSASSADWVFVGGRRFPARLPPAPPPQYHPRDPAEWQGMLVNMAMRPTCENSALCGLATACIENRCGPCEADGDCGRGEVCVLDHCVKKDHVTCRRRADCQSDALCVLTGYSSDPRGNADMKALCQPNHGPTLWLASAWRERRKSAPPAAPPSSAAPVQQTVADKLLSEIKEEKP
jgi:hypothetical protein